jgi:hypothetical protein
VGEHGWLIAKRGDDLVKFFVISLSACDGTHVLREGTEISGAKQPVRLQSEHSWRFANAWMLGCVLI